MVREGYVLAQGGRCSLSKDDVDLVASMVGHQIVAAEWRDDCKPGDTEWTDHEYARITLDDGRVFLFSGYGYDASGAMVGLEEASDG